MVFAQLEAGGKAVQSEMATVLPCFADEPEASQSTRTMIVHDVAKDTPPKKHTARNQFKKKVRYQEFPSWLPILFLPFLFGQNCTTSWNRCN